MSIGSVSMFQAGLAGLAKASKQAEQAAERLAQGAVEVGPVIDLKIAEIGVKASAKTLKAAEELDRATLDILA